MMMEALFRDVGWKRMVEGGGGNYVALVEVMGIFRSILWMS